MSFVIDGSFTCYLMPVDHDEARQRFLDLIAGPGETWIIAYGFTLPGAIDELLAAHGKGVRLHLYLDHTQSAGATERPLVQRLVDAGIEVTIGTSTSGSKYICHTKGFVTDAASGPQCWEGSVNFSTSGWLQVNTAMQFSSRPWRDHFVAQFDTLVAYAWREERTLQLMPEPPAGFAAAGQPMLPLTV
ncbi:phospholipase D-like domain-containing protein [Nocardia pseudobrasiliensis]|uniref:Phospholipase D-like protein n=1 Tax=Nocardia pseudobrasiliensis TaxID=45979 RepID=A0A370I4U3_9NOCA|nr:phospholipase D-like domain-containing protein [Nocardia pseudobrasiliensis]RDI65620.1 phospholipase D-like protein [Nocardia pseudobrasiliensis]